VHLICLAKGRKESHQTSIFSISLSRFFAFARKGFEFGDGPSASGRPHCPKEQREVTGEAEEPLRLPAC